MKHPIPDAALDDRNAFVGTSGSGKTYAASGCVERLLDKSARIIVIDPLGVWYGLRLIADGSSPSRYPIIIFGGPHGDLPLTESAGTIIGETVACMKESCIIDLSQLGTKASERRFMLAFLTSLYRHATGEPVHVVVDEADMWCLDEKTEILTDQGWKRHDQISEDSIAVCFDIGTETYSYGRVQRIIRRQHDGPMVRLKTKGVDCLVTPDHRVVLRRVQRAKGRYALYPWTFCEASKVPTCIGIPLGGAPLGSGVENLSPETCRILGWVITDGGIHNRRQLNRVLCIEQALISEKAGKLIANEIEAVLSKYDGVTLSTRGPRSHLWRGREIRSTPSQRWYLGQELSQSLLQWLGEDIHRIPRNILQNGNRDQITALYQGLLEGDGAAQGGKRWTHFYPGLKVGLADDFQELALRLGVSTTQGPVAKRRDVCVSIASERSAHWIRKPQRETYSGIVWDVTVPTGAFVARRNGRIFVTGNCPQRLLDKEGDAAKLLGMMDTVVRRGRIRGFVPWLITQRPAVISKDVLSQVDGMIALKLTSSQDRDAIGAWIEGQADRQQGKEILASLPAMQIGDGVVWVPGRGILETVKFPAKRTFDSSRTPKRGEKKRTATLKPLDLGALKEKLAAVEAETKENDPKTLKAEITKLQRELTYKSTSDPATTAEAEQRGYQKGYSRGKIDGYADAVKGVEAEFAVVVEAIETVEEQFKAVKGSAAQVKHWAKRPPPKDPGKIITENITAPVPNKPVTFSGDYTRPQRKVLQALAMWRSLGHDAPTREMVAAVAGYSATSGGFANLLGSLKTQGLIDYPSSGLVKVVGTHTVDLISKSQGRDMLLSTLSNPQKKIVAALVGHEDRSRSKVGEETGYSPTSGGFTNLLGSLRTLGIIDYPVPGMVTLSVWAEELFSGIKSIAA